MCEGLDSLKGEGEYVEKSWGKKTMGEKIRLLMQK